MKHLFLWMIVGLLAICAVPAGATSLLVPGDGSGISPNFNTFQDAVDAAVSGTDEIHFTAAGTYAGAHVASKDLAIVADVAGVTVNSLVRVSGSSVASFQGLTCVGAAGNAAFIVQDTAWATLTDCDVSNGGGDGFQTYNTGKLTLENSRVQNNAWMGIREQGGDLEVTSGSVISGNAQNGLGIYTTNATITITDSAVSSNTLSNVFNQTASTFNISNSQLSGSINQYGIWNYAAGATFNISNGSLIAGNTLDGIACEYAATFELDAATVSGNKQSGVRVEGDNSAGTVLRVLNGSLIEGNGVGKANNSNVGCGLSFYRHANATISDSIIRDNASWGIQCGWNTGTSTHTLTNTVISGNGNQGYRVESPSGVHVNIQMDGVTFEDNALGAVWFNSQGGADSNTLVADACTFNDGSGNSQNLLYLRTTISTITNSVMNEGLNMVFAEGTGVTLQHCTLVSRSGLSTCGFFNNWDPSHSVQNCIIDGPQYGFNGGNGMTVVANNNNLVRATVSNFGSITPGLDNIEDVDPMFVTASSGPGTGDFHLQSDSPALLGGAELTPAVAMDFDGNSRPMPMGTTPDIGAYEEQTLVPVELSGFTLE